MEFLACLGQCRIRDSKLLGEYPHGQLPDLVVEVLAVVTGHQSSGHSKRLLGGAGCLRLGRPYRARPPSSRGYFRAFGPYGLNGRTHSLRTFPWVCTVTIAWTIPQYNQ